MRPVVLRLQAFTAYAAEEIIDFRQLGTHRLMMIAGETGSGKTALLDAMAYALFGGSTGGARGESSYRSDHASDGCLTLVDFQFELQGKLYRAIRYPAQKGKSQGQYALRRIASVGDEEGALLASKKKAMSDKVEALLGYNMRQFRSVVVLPQGQFREFLSAKTEVKAVILSGLFRTERYRRLEEGLKHREKLLSNAQRDVHKQITGILERLDAEDDEALQGQVKDLKAQVRTLEAAVQSLHKVTAGCAAREKEAADLSKKFSDLGDTNQAIAGLEAQATDRLLQDAALKRARRAALIQPVDDVRGQRREELSGLREKVGSAEEKSTDAATGLEEATGELHTAASHIPDIETAQGELVTLQGHRELVAKLDTLRGTEEGQVMDLKRAAGDRQKAKRSQREAEEDQQHLEGLREGQQTLASGLGSAQAEYDTSSARLKLRRDLTALGRNLSARADELQQAESAHADLVGKADQAKSVFNDFYVRHLADYAAQLAGDLADGAPCPVCGAEEHPVKASPQEGAPDKQAVDAVRLASEKAQQRQVDGAEAVRVAEATRAKVAEQVKLHEEALGDSQRTSEEELVEATAAAEQQLASARAASAALPETTAKLAAGKSALEALAQGVVQAEEQEREADSALQGTRLLAAEQAKQIPEDLRTLAAVDGRIAQTEARVVALKNALEAARTRESKAREALATAKTTLSNLRGSLETAEVKLREAEAALSRALVEGDFATEEAYLEAVVPPAELEALAEWIREYDQGINRLRGQREQLAKEVAGKDAPDLEAVAAATKEAQEAEDAKRDELTGAHRLLSPKETGISDIENLRARHAAREAQCQVMKALYKAARGDNGRKLNFERYVLTGLLDEVLVHASRRLKQMSGGRYILQRKDPFRGEEKGSAALDKRRQAGLELEVVDAYTSKARDASTLSGGEGFQASLSLALGLADVIQSQAGGIELAAMFIDEGFGTQSGEALESVFTTLTALQDSGRLVGFISHVEGMKERIPAKLIVTKTPTGSWTEFKVS
jgi:DNA repair protein SbcC/Rad50